ICTPCESKTGPDTDPNVNTQGTAASTASLTSSFNSPTPSACATCNPAKPAIRGQRVSRLTQDEAERAAAWADVLSEVAVADSLRSDASYTVVQAFYVSAHGVT